jgi:hypothetical protein
MELLECGTLLCFQVIMGVAQMHLLRLPPRFQGNGRLFLV